MRALNVAASLLVWPLAALPQATVEYGAAVGRAGVTGASMGAAGKSTGKLLDQSVKGMQKVQSQKGKVVTKVAKGVDSAPPVAVKVPRPSSNTPSIDPAAIPVGLERDELFRQFGKPSTRITQQQGTDVVEKCWYKAAGFDPVVVTLRNGKVASVGT